MKNGLRQELLKAAAERIRAANSIVAACHIRPDADALGSLLGLTLGLEQLGKSVQAVSADGVPALYRFLPGWERVRTRPEGEYDLGIGLDCDGSDRMGPVEAALLTAPVVIDIDHHTGPDPFGDVQLVDRTAAATAELVFDLLTELGVTLTPDIAQCLLAAILTDTGSFRYSNVTADTFRKAAVLVEAGVHPNPIYEAVYGVRRFEASCLLGRLLGRLERTADGRIVWGFVTQRDFQETGTTSEDTEGFVDQIRMVEGSEVALFLREEANGEIRVSLRSHGKANVAAVAERFGGGGHVPAAGCSLMVPLDEAIRQVVRAAQEQLPPDSEVAGDRSVETRC